MQYSFESSQLRKLQYYVTPNAYISLLANAFRCSPILIFVASSLHPDELTLRQLSRRGQHEHLTILRRVSIIKKRILPLLGGSFARTPAVLAAVYTLPRCIQLYPMLNDHCYVPNAGYKH